MLGTIRYDILQIESGRHLDDHVWMPIAVNKLSFSHASFTDFIIIIVDLLIVYTTLRILFAT